jgi:hypothetical protein
MAAASTPAPDRPSAIMSLARYASTPAKTASASNATIALRERQNPSGPLGIPKKGMTGSKAITKNSACTLLTTPSVHRAAASPIHSGRQGERGARAAISKIIKPQVTSAAASVSVRKLRAFIISPPENVRQNTASTEICQSRMSRRSSSAKATMKVDVTSSDSTRPARMACVQTALNAAASSAFGICASDATSSRPSRCSSANQSAVSTTLR